MAIVLAAAVALVLTWGQAPSLGECAGNSQRRSDSYTEARSTIEARAARLLDALLTQCDS